MANKYQSLIERLYLKILKTETCWIWTGTVNADGYGILRLNNKTLLAHRVSYDYHIGPIPDGMLVCHKCDNPPCLNPNHLFLGSKKDNKQDSVKKKRAVFGNNKKLSVGELTEIQTQTLNGVRPIDLYNKKFKHIDYSHLCKVMRDFRGGYYFGL